MAKERYEKTRDLRRLRDAYEVDENEALEGTLRQLRAEFYSGDKRQRTYIVRQLITLFEYMPTKTETTDQSQRPRYSGPLAEKIRMAEGVTVEALSKEIGVSAGTIRKYEKDRIPPTSKGPAGKKYLRWLKDTTNYDPSE